METSLEIFTLKRQLPNVEQCRLECVPVISA